MERPDSRPDLPQIEIPVLVLVGAEDASTPPEFAREMAEAIEWASLVVVPDCGHLSTLERPDAVTRALEAWLVAEAA
jgi:pimeloyl-ACP methyl ester carboxylesterase